MLWVVDSFNFCFQIRNLAVQVFTSIRDFLWLIFVALGLRILQHLPESAELSALFLCLHLALQVS